LFSLLAGEAMATLPLPISRLGEKIKIKVGRKKKRKEEEQKEKNKYKILKNKILFRKLQH